MRRGRNVSYICENLDFGLLLTVWNPALCSVIELNFLFLHKPFSAFKSLGWLIGKARPKNVPLPRVTNITRHAHTCVHIHTYECILLSSYGLRALPCFWQGYIKNCTSFQCKCILSQWSFAEGTFNLALFLSLSLRIRQVSQYILIGVGSSAMVWWCKPASLSFSVSPVHFAFDHLIMTLMYMCYLELV